MYFDIFFVVHKSVFFVCLLISRTGGTSQISYRTQALYKSQNLETQKILLLVKTDFYRMMNNIYNFFVIIMLLIRKHLNTFDTYIIKINSLKISGANLYGPMGDDPSNNLFVKPTHLLFYFQFFFIFQSLKRNYLDNVIIFFLKIW